MSYKPFSTHQLTIPFLIISLIFNILKTMMYSFLMKINATFHVLCHNPRRRLLQNKWTIKQMIVHSFIIWWWNPCYFVLLWFFKSPTKYEYMYLAMFSLLFIVFHFFYKLCNCCFFKLYSYHNIPKIHLFFQLQ